MSLHPVLNYHLTADDELHVCPYDSSHQVLHPRLCRHLVKCRTAYLKEVSRTNKKCDIGICKWNSNHHISYNNLPSHELQCKDRECMTDFLRYHADPEFKLPGPAPAPTAENKNMKGSGKKAQNVEEDWEPSLKEKEKQKSVGISSTKHLRSAPQPMYDPTDKLMREPIIYTPQGLTKSELKAHRESEHLRWEELKLRELVIIKDKAEEKEFVNNEKILKGSVKM